VANVVVSALATWNGKALKKAKQDVNVFDKQLKSLARTLGFTFSATAIVAFSKKAVKAFAEDQAAAKSLQLQLENTGNAFRATEVEDYIKNLEKTYAILTDLRGPFQTLLNVTNSVDLAQRSLEAALDISAGTGQSLATVVGAISAGVRGQTKAIRGLNTGIDENILATGDMNKIMAELERRFSGQAASRLGTYAGKMDMLKKSSDEATKAIGAGLVDALTILSKDQSIENLANNFENLGNNIAFAVRELAKLVNGFNNLVNNPTFKAGLLALAILSRNSKAVAAAFTIVGGSAIGGALTKDYSGKPGSNFTYGAGNPRADLVVSKNLTKARKEEFKIINQKNKIENKNLEELKKKFDLERIGLTQALNVATDEETKLRLKAQLAILDENESLAKKLLAELEAIEALKKLTDSANKLDEAFRNMIRSMLDQIKPTLNELQALSMGALKSETRAILDYGAPAVKGLQELIAPTQPGTFEDLRGNISGLLEQARPSISGLQQLLSGIQQTSAPTLNLKIDAGGDRMSQAIAESIQVATRSGYSTVPNGFIV
jgi:post-segregation antitoxin (ccd killing protein)